MRRKRTLSICRTAVSLKEPAVLPVSERSMNTQRKSVTVALADGCQVRHQRRLLREQRELRFWVDTGQCHRTAAADDGPRQSVTFFLRGSA